MNRRHFLEKTAIATAAGFTSTMSLAEKADALEENMAQELDKLVYEPPLCDIDDNGRRRSSLQEGQHVLMGDDPRLPKMPDRPTLLDFFNGRMASTVGRAHLLQSAKLAKDNRLPEKIILACLLHDISVTSLIRSDHGYWCAQLVAPYVDEEVSWAIRFHQALRFFPDESVGYKYPEAYVRFFGEDYQVPEYIARDAEYARKHKWYMSSRLVTLNDKYAFDPNTKVEIDEFTDIIGRHFKQPREGLGFDGSPSAHMWRTIIWPNNFL